MRVCAGGSWQPCYIHSPGCLEATASHQQLRGAEAGRPSLPLALLSPHNVAYCHSVQVGGILGDPLSQEQIEQYNVFIVSEK